MNDEPTDDEWYELGSWESPLFDSLAIFSCPITFGPVEYDEDDVLNNWWLNEHQGAWIDTAGIPSQRPQ